MAPKMITDREKAGRTLDSALEAHGPLLVEGLEEFFAPVLEEGEEMPDFEQLIRLMRRAAAHHRDRMTETENRWKDLKTERNGLRYALEEARKVVREMLTKLRRWLKAQIGRKAAGSKMGVRGNTPRDVTRLLMAGWQLHGNLEEIEPKYPGIQLEADKLGAQLRERLENLDETQVRLMETVKAVDAAVVEKKEAFDANNETFIDLASMTVAFYRMAGYPELAEAVQPSRRRRGLTLNQAKQARSSKS